MPRRHLAELQALHSCRKAACLTPVSTMVRSLLHAGEDLAQKVLASNQRNALRAACICKEAPCTVR